MYEVLLGEIPVRCDSAADVLALLSLERQFRGKTIAPLPRPGEMRAPVAPAEMARASSDLDYRPAACEEGPARPGRDLAAEVVEYLEKCGPSFAKVIYRAVDFDGNSFLNPLPRQPELFEQLADGRWTLRAAETASTAAPPDERLPAADGATSDEDDAPVADRAEYLAAARQRVRTFLERAKGHVAGTARLRKIANVPLGDMDEVLHAPQLFRRIRRNQWQLAGAPPRAATAGKPRTLAARLDNSLTDKIVAQLRRRKWQSFQDISAAIGVSSGVVLEELNANAERFAWDPHSGKWELAEGST